MLYNGEVFVLTSSTPINSLTASEGNCPKEGEGRVPQNIFSSQIFLSQMQGDKMVKDGGTDRTC